MLRKGYMKIIYRRNIVVRLFSYILFLSLVWADPPDWVDTSGDYEFTASMTAAVYINGESLGAEGDILAAFDESGNVRGIGSIQAGIGPSTGLTFHAITIRSNADGDEISFQYYDASADIIYDLQGTYDFGINDLVGNLMTPHILPHPFTFNQSL